MLLIVIVLHYLGPYGFNLINFGGFDLAPKLSTLADRLQRRWWFWLLWLGSFRRSRRSLHGTWVFLFPHNLIDGHSTIRGLLRIRVDFLAQWRLRWGWGFPFPHLEPWFHGLKDCRGQDRLALPGFVYDLIFMHGASKNLFHHHFSMKIILWIPFTKYYF